jgi:hypothetical protein
MAKKRHTNTGTCEKCAEILQSAHVSLQSFAKEFQKKNPDGHISWAHRGEDDQQAAYVQGKSKATFGNSPHNYRPALAIDWFRLTDSGARWDAPWFRDKLGPAARAHGLVWGGDFKSFVDLPHVEMANWKGLRN